MGYEKYPENLMQKKITHINISIPRFTQIITPTRYFFLFSKYYFKNIIYLKNEGI